VVLFVGSGAIQLMLSHWMPGSVAEILFKVSTGILAFGVTVYTGIILKNIKGVPFWNSILLPILFVLCGILGGFGLSVVIALAGGDVNLSAAEWGSRILLIANVLVIILYLFQAEQREEVGKQSVMEQLRGNNAPIFWIGIVSLGIAIPLAIAVTSLVAGEIASGLLVFGVICEIIGGLALRYCVLKAGAYQPLVAKAQ
jgi:polysulfide reductase chain C